MKSGGDLIRENISDGKDDFFDFSEHRLLEVECDGILYDNLLGAEIKIVPPHLSKGKGGKEDESSNWILDINLKHYMKDAEGD